MSNHQGTASATVAAEKQQAARIAELEQALAAAEAQRESDRQARQKAEERARKAVKIDSRLSRYVDTKLYNQTGTIVRKESHQTSVSSRGLWLTMANEKWLELADIMDDVIESVLAYESLPDGEKPIKDDCERQLAKLKAAAKAQQDKDDKDD
jgi:hypothetical protein